MVYLQLKYFLKNQTWQDRRSDIEKRNKQESKNLKEYPVT